MGVVYLYTITFTIPEMHCPHRDGRWFRASTSSPQSFMGELSPALQRTGAGAKPAFIAMRTLRSSSSETPGLRLPRPGRPGLPALLCTVWDLGFQHGTGNSSVSCRRLFKRRLLRVQSQERGWPLLQAAAQVWSVCTSGANNSKDKQREKHSSAAEVARFIERSRLSQKWLVQSELENNGEEPHQQHSTTTTRRPSGRRK